jgi:hypothetical protein
MILDGMVTLVKNQQRHVRHEQQSVPHKIQTNLRCHHQHLVLGHFTLPFQVSSMGDHMIF